VHVAQHSRLRILAKMKLPSADAGRALLSPKHGCCILMRVAGEGEGLFGATTLGAKAQMHAGCVLSVCLLMQFQKGKVENCDPCALRPPVIKVPVLSAALSKAAAHCGRESGGPRQPLTLSFCT
jgi:hypothetical protein